MSANYSVLRLRVTRQLKSSKDREAYRKFPCKCGGYGGQGGARTRLPLYYHLSACEVSQGILSI